VLWQARALASSAGTLFIRSFERGERVHMAMVSRGYAGAMPELAAAEASSTDWLAASLVPAMAAVICAGAWL
jgi:cobalt/nickel transport system permease protein